MSSACIIHLHEVMNGPESQLSTMYNQHCTDTLCKTILLTATDKGTTCDRLM